MPVTEGVGKGRPGFFWLYVAAITVLAEVLNTGLRIHSESQTQCDSRPAPVATDDEELREN